MIESTPSSGSRNPSPRQRFGYVVFTGRDTFDARVWPRDATAANLAELEELTAVLFEVQPFVMAMEIVERCYEELLAAVDGHNAALAAADPGALTMVHLEGFIAISQRITSLLATASAFLATCEVQMKRLHGEGATEVMTWLGMKNQLHATHFAYRFLYELRNYCQHANLPFSELKSSSQIAEDRTTTLVTSGVLLNRDKLLSDSFRWKPKLIPEIRSQNADFDFMPLAITYVNCLRRLCLEAIAVKARRLVEMDQYLGVVLKSLHVPDGGIPVVFIGEDTAPDYPPTQHRLIPIHQRQWLADRVERLLRECTIEGPA